MKVSNPKNGVIIVVSKSKLLQVYDVVAPRTATLFNRFHQALVRHSAEASKSKSVFPLLSQGVIRLMDVGSEIAKTKVQPLIKEIRESRREH